MRVINNSRLCSDKQPLLYSRVGKKNCVLFLVKVNDNSFTFSGIIFALGPYKLKAIQSGEIFIAESTQGIFAYNKGDIYLSEVAKGQVASLHAKCKIF